MTTTTFEALKTKKPENIEGVIGHVSRDTHNFFDVEERFGQSATHDSATFWGTYFATDRDTFTSRNNVQDSYYYLQYDQLPLLVRQQFPRWFQYKFDHFEIDYYPWSIQYTASATAIANAPSQPFTYNFDLTHLKTTAFAWGQHFSEIQYNSAVVGSKIKEFNVPITRSAVKRWYTPAGGSSVPVGGVQYSRAPGCGEELQHDNILRQQHSMQSINIKCKPYAETTIVSPHDTGGVTNDVTYSSDFHATATRDGTHDKRAWGAIAIRNAFTSQSAAPLNVIVHGKVKVKWMITFNSSKNATALPSVSYADDCEELLIRKKTWEPRGSPQSRTDFSDLNSQTEQALGTYSSSSQQHQVEDSGESIPGLQCSTSGVSQARPSGAKQQKRLSPASASYLEAAKKSKLHYQAPQE